MVREFDGIVVGGGHNGLICASYLAKAGWKMAVVERNQVMGGGCSTEEIAAPGYRHNTHSCYHFIGEGPVLDDLQLHKYGLSYIYPEVQHAQIFRDGKAVTIHRDFERTVQSIARFSRADAERYREVYHRFGHKMGPLMTQFMYSDPLSPAELADRFSGPDSDELFSYAPLTLHQAVERNFENEYVRMFFNCILHAVAVENIPGVGLLFPRLLTRLNKLGLPVNGAVSVSLALERLLEEHGATLIRGRHVSAITSDSEGVTGVRLDNGDILSSRLVASSIDAPQTIRIAGEENFPGKVVEGLRNYEWCAHSLVTLHVALNEPPRYEAAEKFDPDVARAWDTVFGADTTAEIDRVFDEVHEGKLPTRLAGNSCCSSKFDPSLAPAGKHVAFWWPWAPYELDGDPANWDVREDEISETMLSQWREFAPNMNEKNVVAKAIFSPVDIERHCINMVRGSHHSGAYTPTQLGANRPIPELGHYGTPLKGLYLCGASSHAGGAVTGSPGYNAVRRIAQDYDVKKWWKPVPRPAWPPRSGEHG
ncbi:NAD(P)/FAD-dependent oxidoreductase [Bradyrhizobium sp. WSM3983]|uniref:phytoene desaturase family protein n=1 Tax=Bradyrhizobium sp. WSM3983 TaxID=1038867 RepID=UPI0004031FE8|nr:NAD(P)/FAD-dependent oxidoreductase [Bradyrhizobium sp. WSM3983]